MALLRRKPKEERPAEAIVERRGFRSLFNRFVATMGIVGIGTAVAAILGSQEVDAWVVGLVASVLSVVLAAIVWSPRAL